jgi:transcriptional regulator with XRE-family HTH domain
MRCDGRRVIQAREALGLSQQEVAHDADVSRSVIKRRERGASVFGESIRMVAGVLGLSELRHPEEISEASE